MRGILPLIMLIEAVTSDSRLLGYEIGQIGASLSSLLTELPNSFLKSKDLVNNTNITIAPFSFSYNSSPKKSYKKFPKIALILCHIEGVWSIALGEWILCSLSRTFARMKLDYILPPAEFDQSLPKKSYKNKKIYEKDAKYLQKFFEISKQKKLSTVILDTYYYTLQHATMTTHSLATLPFPSAISKNQANTKNCNFASSSPHCPISPPPHHIQVYNICNGFLDIIPANTHLFYKSQSFNKEEELNEDLEENHRKLKSEIEEACQKFKSTTLQQPSTAAASSPFTSPHLPSISSHSSLIQASHKNLPIMFLTFNHYRNEIFHLQMHVLNNFINAKRDSTASWIVAASRLFSFFESLNLSLFSISIFCGEEFNAPIKYYTLHDNIFNFIDNNAPTLHERIYKLGDYLSNKALSTDQLKKSFIAQLQLLRSVTEVSYTVLSFEELRMDIQAASEDALEYYSRGTVHDSLDEEFWDGFSSNSSPQPFFLQDYNRAAKLMRQIRRITSFLTSILETEGDQEWRIMMSQWRRNEGHYCEDFKYLARKLMEYSSILTRWVDLEKVYSFPLRYLLKKGGVKEVKLPFPNVWRNNEGKMEDRYKRVVTASDGGDRKIVLKSLKRLSVETNEQSNTLMESPENTNEDHSNSLHSLSKKKNENTSTNSDATLGGSHQRNGLESTNRDVNPTKPNLEGALADLLSKALDSEGSPLLPSTDVVVPPSFDLPLEHFLEDDDSLEYNPDLGSPTYQSLMEFFDASDQKNDYSPRRRLGQDDMPLSTASSSRLSYLLQQNGSSLFSFVMLRHETLFGHKLSNNDIFNRNINLIWSNEKWSNYKGEMQFWLLMNHHSSRISACFTYSIENVREGEIFNSSISMPDPITLFVNSNSTSFGAGVIPVYGWKIAHRVRDYQLALLDPFVQFLQQRELYRNQSSALGYRAFHSVPNKYIFDIIDHYRASMENQHKIYMGSIENRAPYFSLRNLYFSLTHEVHHVLYPLAPRLP